MEKKKLHVIVLVVCLVPMLRVDAQTVNRAPHFIPGSGDLARFSLSENTPVGSPVYQLKGETRNLLFFIYFGINYLIPL